MTITSTPGAGSRVVVGGRTFEFSVALNRWILLVRLTDREIARANDLGTRRRDDSREHDMDYEVVTSKRTDYDQYSQDVNNVAAVIGFCKAFDLSHDFPLGVRPTHPDYGIEARYVMRTIRFSHHRMPIRDYKDPSDRIYVCALPSSDLTEIRYTGCSWGFEHCNERYIYRGVAGEPPAFFIPQDVLRPIWDIPCY